MRYLIVFFIFVESIVIAQTEVAIIQNADGYTNIRKGKGTNTPIVSKIQENEFFYYEPSASENWLKVSKIQDVKGYIHKSRILPLSVLSRSEKRILILEVFQKEELSYLNLKNSIDKKNEWETHHERKFDPILGIASVYICKHKDSELMNLFLKILISESGSADEASSFALGRIYLCQPDWTVNLVKQKKSSFLLKALKWGFENETYQNEEKYRIIKSLRKKLEKI